MTAYIIGIRDRLHDAEAMERYKDAALPTLEGGMSRFLAAYGPFRVLEGQAAEGAFILEFESFEAAEAWFDGPAYGEAMKIREGAADYRLVLVNGVE